ncbi:MAG: ATP-binding cassette domain-containing protein [Longimicrobiales bacterium]
MPGTAQSPVLAAASVSKRFGPVLALDRVSLAVDAGECVALVGESGSGKSTLLRCFNRLVEPDSGTVMVSGTDVRQSDPTRLRRGIGYVPQDGGLLPHWRVRKNIALVPRLLGWPDADARADTALDLVGLSPGSFADRWPRQLSGGQRQRVAIARALAAQSAILLLDEPFGALDAITRAELQDAFLEVRAEIAITALLVTHDLHEATLLGDRIAVLRTGRLEQCASAAELRRAPASPYVRTLLERARLLP